MYVCMYACMYGHLCDFVSLAHDLADLRLVVPVKLGHGPWLLGVLDQPFRGRMVEIDEQDTGILLDIEI